jgi:hypothetical protein
MNGFRVLQYALFLGVALALVQPVGRYLQRVFAGERTVFDPVLRTLERVNARSRRTDGAAHLVAPAAVTYEASYNTPDIGAMLLTSAIRHPEEGSMGSCRDRVPQGRPR